MVPNGWKEAKLESNINFVSGHAFKSAEFKKGAYYKLLRGINITRGALRWSEEQTFTWNNASGFEKYLLNANDIVISMDGSLVGRNYALITEKNYEPMLLVQRVARIRCKPALNHNYLLQHIASDRFKSYVDSVKTVTAIPHISAKDIKHFIVPMPAIEEQRKIAKILSTWDKAISTTERLIDNSKQQKKALMQQLLTGAHTQRKRLLDDSGKPFEGEWKKVELGKLLDYKQPTPYLVKSTEYSDEYNTPVLTAGKTFVLGYSNEDFGIFSENLPVIIFDDFTTASKFVDFPFKAKSSAMKILIAIEGVSIKYIYEAMQVLNYPVGGHQRHWISIFSNLVIGLPTLEEQQKIAAVLSNADKEVELLEKQLSDLKQEKKALMQQLLTGKRRVKV